MFIQIAAEMDLPVCKEMLLGSAFHPQLKFKALRRANKFFKTHETQHMYRKGCKFTTDMGLGQGCCRMQVKHPLHYTLK